MNVLFAVNTMSPLESHIKKVNVTAQQHTTTKTIRRSIVKSTKKPRKSRRQYDFSVEMMSRYFHMSQRDAAKQLGVAVITMKRNCKRRGINWPYRMNKSKHKHEAKKESQFYAYPAIALTAAGLAYARLPLDCAVQNEVEEC